MALFIQGEPFFEEGDEQKIALEFKKEYATFYQTSLSVSAFQVTFDSEMQNCTINVGGIRSFQGEISGEPSRGIDVDILLQHGNISMSVSISMLPPQE